MQRLYFAPHAPRRQRGAATLIVVMLLFFVVSLAAAYASRNLIFEQRTASNQLRSNQVQEATEAGLNWALTMLNSGRIDENCEITADAAQNTFRQRYLAIDAATGNISAVANATNAAQNLWAACVFDGNAWSCRCPTGTLAAGALPNGSAAFAVRFGTASGTAATRRGAIRIEVNGCTSNDYGCLRYVEPLATSRCRSSACAVLGLYAGIRTTPTAALTARQAVNGNTLQLINQETSVGSVAVHAGGAVDAGINVVGATGSSRAAAIRESDAPAFGWLGADSAECTQCLFANVFGLRPDTFRRLQGTVNMDCSGGCTANDVNDVLGNARSRVLYLSGAGGLTIDGAVAIGTAADPVVLIVDGPLVFAAGAGAATVQGVVYANSIDIAGGTVTGAMFSATTVTASGGTVAYNLATIRRLARTTGTFVRIPGSWRDHP